MREMSQNSSQRQPTYQIFICLITVVLIESCSTAKFTQTVPGQPLKQSYSFSKDHSFNIDKLDTAAIYVNEEDWILTGDYGMRKKHQFVFLKFSNNGIAYYSNYSEDPFTDSSLLTVSGQYCYYRIEGDELKLEFYDHLIKKFRIWSAKIYPDKLHFYKNKLRVWGGGKGKLNFVFQKREVAFNKPLIWPE
jgi:hypothetical protein